MHAGHALTRAFDPTTCARHAAQRGRLRGNKTTIGVKRPSFLPPLLLLLVSLVSIRALSLSFSLSFSIFLFLFLSLSFSLFLFLSLSLFFSLNRRSPRVSTNTSWMTAVANTTNTMDTAYTTSVTPKDR